VKIDYTAWRFWFDILQFGLTGMIGFYVWWSSRQKGTDKRFKRLETQMADAATKTDLDTTVVAQEAVCSRHKQETRALVKALHALETEVKTMPSRSEVKGLADSMAGLTEKIGKLEGRLEGINRVADLINEFLIKQGGKR